MLEAYARQTVRCPFLIWNNNQELVDKLEGFVKRAKSELGIDVTLYHHPENVGGFGRFYAARDMVETEFVLFTDDDWLLKPNYIEHLSSHLRSNTISGLWCWKYPTHKSRSRVVAGPCDYIGTCGMVAPREAFDHERLYQTVPKKYWFIEDIWLCFFARYELGYKLLARGRLETYAKNMNRDDKGNLIERVPGLADKVWNLKPEFVRYLIERFR